MAGNNGPGPGGNNQQQVCLRTRIWLELPV